MSDMIIDKNQKNALENRLNKANIKHYFVEEDRMVVIPDQLEVTSHITENGIEHYFSDDLSEISGFYG